MQCEIKQLEWKDDEVDPNFIEARTAFIITYYAIRKKPRITLYGTRGGGVNYCKTIEDAKIVAQTDFENEVMKFLNIPLKGGADVPD